MHGRKREIPIQCPSNVYGYAVDATGTFRVRCKGKFCNHARGTVVFHSFDLSTGELRTEESSYRNPSELLGQRGLGNDIR